MSNTAGRDTLHRTLLWSTHLTASGLFGCEQLDSTQYWLYSTEHRLYSTEHAWFVSWSYIILVATFYTQHSTWKSWFNRAQTLCDTVCLICFMVGYIPRSRRLAHNTTHQNRDFDVRINKFTRWHIFSSISQACLRIVCLLHCLRHLPRRYNRTKRDFPCLG